MEFRHLKYFVAVAEELHFGRAAERLQMAQPPLSQQIRQLEQELGVALFYRTKRRVSLTEAGRVFLDEARTILGHSEQAVRATQRAGRGETGQLVVGFVSSALYETLPAILRLFRARFPDVTLALRELTTNQQMQALRDGRMHIGFVRLPVDDHGLAVECIVREPLMVVLADTHPLASLPEVPLRALAGEPFVMFPRHLRLGSQDRLINLCRAAGFNPEVAQEAIQMETIVNLVAAGFGVALVPASVRHARLDGVAYRLVCDPASQVELASAWRPDDDSPVLRSFLRVLDDLPQSLSNLNDPQLLERWKTLMDNVRS